MLKAIDELIAIAKASGGPAEIYHLKQAGPAIGASCEPMIDRIEAARASGIRITADMYTYTAGATGLDAAMPPWVQRRRLRASGGAAEGSRAPRRGREGNEERPVGWDNLYFQAGGPDKVLFLGFKNPALKQYTGKTLADVAKERGKSARGDRHGPGRRGRQPGRHRLLPDERGQCRAAQAGLPWMAFDSDESAQAPRGVFLKSNTHPRAYGNFARLLGKYVREEKRTTLQDAVRRLTSFPATNLGIKDRGFVKAGMKADLAIFDPATIADKATFDQPQQFAVGMRHVFVNGQAVLINGEMTGARPGRAVRGPGYQRCPAQ